MALSLEPVDLLLSGGEILTLDAAGTRIPEGALAVRDGRIVALGPAAELAARYIPRERLDTTGCVVMPGLVNAHTHAPMTLLRGLADDLPLMEWLEEHIFPAERRLTGAAVRCGTLLACAEMIRSGTTTVCDMYLFESFVAAAFREAGVRALVGEVLFDFPSPSYGAPENGLRATRELWQRWQGDELIRVAVMPHALYTCSPARLRECAALAAELGAPLVMHVAETAAETARIQAAYGKRSIPHLDDLGLLTANLVAVHAVDLSPAEIALLAERGVRVCHNPESNLKLASGVAPVPQLLAAGVTVGLGTDGCASNNDLDMFGEMDSCAKIHKLGHGPTVMSAATTLGLATAGGAAALGWGGEIGRLAVGWRADVIAVDFNQPHLTPCSNPVSHLVYAARGGDVRHSVIQGRVVLRERQLTTLDEAAILAQARALARQFH